MAGFLWGAAKWILLTTGLGLVIAGIATDNAIKLAAMAGVACFAAIVARVCQAEQHHRP